LPEAAQNLKRLRQTFVKGELVGDKTISFIGSALKGAGAQTGNVAGIGTLIGAVIGDGLSSLGEELKEIADENGKRIRKNGRS